MKEEKGTSKRGLVDRSQEEGTRIQFHQPCYRHTLIIFYYFCCLSSVFCLLLSVVIRTILAHRVNVTCSFLMHSTPNRFGCWLSVGFFCLFFCCSFGFGFSFDFLLISSVDYFRHSIYSESIKIITRRCINASYRRCLEYHDASESTRKTSREPRWLAK